ncbi:MAG: FecR domain-containing protein [Lentimonas sp.]
MSSIYQRMTFRLSIISAMIACALSTLNAQNFSLSTPGIAIVTSTQGAAQIIDPTEGTFRVALHEALSLSDQTIQTKQDGHLFLACSNGLGIGIDATTEVSFISYKQSPFSEERAKLDFEPSTSAIDIKLISGAINVSSEGISPRSQVRVNTPNGTVRIHSANCRIEQSDTGTTIITFGGNATFYYANGEHREFISKFNGIRINALSASLGEITEIIDMTQIDPTKQAFADATFHASNRVHFKATVGDAPATPILIMPSTYYEIPSARPYEYTE